MINVRKLWENSNITTFFPSMSSRVRFDEPMKEHTTFRTGGPADLFIVPENGDELCALVDFFADQDVPVSILGGGSNILVSDNGIRGAIISFDSLGGITSHIDSEGARLCVSAGAGSSINALTHFCLTEKLSGLERFAGLPGSVGGALFMNARCYEMSVSDVILYADVLHFLDGGCIIEKYRHNSGDWGYKKSPFQVVGGIDQLLLGEDRKCILSATFAVSEGLSDSIRSEMEKYVSDREGKGHFRFPSAGSMFKNNHDFGMPSGKIIDEAGLRGFRIGDAQVSPWHGNFVINAGNACSTDVRALVEEIKTQVYRKTGFSLECEVIFAGDW